MMQEKFSFPKGRFLVTGAAGFIGSHLSGRLLEEGCDVVGVDNLITGNRENVLEYLGNPRFQLLEHDIVQPLSLSGTFAGIFHFASPASPLDYLNYPIETLHVGAMGTDQMLRLAERHSCPILVASTSEVYGDPLEHPQRESYWGNVNPIGLRSCYDESKRYLEALTMAYHRKRRLRVRLIRIFNTYGPRMKINDGRVVPNFLAQALSHKDLTVYGDGKQTRSFCFVDDMVEGVIRAFSCDYSEPINLGNPEELTILEFADKIIRLSGADIRIAFHPLPQDDPRTRRPDISKARKLLGWEPKVSLDVGLKKTLEYFKAKMYYR